jgi:hypothetical protein
MGQRINEWTQRGRKRIRLFVLHSLTALPGHRFKSGLKQGDGLQGRGTPRPVHLTHPRPSASPSLSIR